MMSFEQSNIYIIARCNASRLAIFLMACAVLVGFSGSAKAFCSSCYAEVQSADSDIWQEVEDEFDQKLDEEFKRLESFIIHEMWEQSILPAMMLAAEQFTAVALQQAMAIGMFIDAEIQMDAQRLLQELRAKAHKDYHPSIGMCEFGTMMKSLAATERRGEVTAVMLSQRSQDRQLGRAHSTGMYGNDLDQYNRIDHFKRLFCNVQERDNALETICNTTMKWGDAAFNQAARLRVNKDIDYFSLINSPWTLTLDFTNQEILDTTSTPNIHNEDEEHVLAMAGNLFGHTTFPRIPPRLLENQPKYTKLTNMQKAYMDLRAIVAKRSVAENSFYAIAGMKAEGNKSTAPSGGSGVCPSGGTPAPPVGGACVTAGGSAGNGVPVGGPANSRVYMEHILKELGVPSVEALSLLGQNPSYYAQMEVLTKKLYQNPDFYTNLYDKPANIERKTVALQAIKLMQKFDILKSFLRGEASVSILLELAVSDLQTEIEDTIQAIDTGGR